LADSIGKLWEVCDISYAIVKQRKKCILFGKDYQLLQKSSWGGQDIFSSRFLGYKFVTEAAKIFFEQFAPNCLQFEEIIVA
jgi:hypothetical protein